MRLNLLATVSANFKFQRVNQFDNVRRYSAVVNSAAPFVKRTGSNHDVALVSLVSRSSKVLKRSSLQELAETLADLQNDKTVGAIILTGTEDGFCAGTNFDVNTSAESIDLLEDRLRSISKPVIAAVNGYAFNFGFELAMMCDFIYAEEGAKFALKYISMGTIPRSGGSQRLPRTIGKSKAMELILTGCEISTTEAQRIGIVRKVFSGSKQLLEESVKTGAKLATYSQLISQISKECVNTALESTLREGIRFEKLMANATFATDDWKEGAAAFMQKRPPIFKHQ
ncbi:probable enoyl-CoA hydratase [Cylas formicarius]|uniref:probable enoyl-CoA hydratase n=1 Tax=Cylas formicarius TaxID=197179 RepID=UPI002958AB20|nr:probable enoyl-CoA hydratase [Cylas formicarius]